MNKIIGFFIFIFCVYSVINALSNSPSANLTQYQISSIHDGDTMRVLDSKGHEFRVRFACIDTREIGQKGGEDDRDFLRQLLARHDNRVRLEIIKRDKYNRTVAVVWTDNVLVPLAQVEAGQAFVYHQYADSCPYYEQLKKAEIIARKKKIGVWGQKSIVYPWQWRHRNQSKISR